MDEINIARLEARNKLLRAIKGLPDTYQCNLVRELAIEYAEMEDQAMQHMRLVANQLMSEAGMEID